jgi:hypothetical protein
VSKTLLLYNDECDICKELAGKIRKFTRGKVRPIPLRSEEAAHILQKFYNISYLKSFFLVEKIENRYHCKRGFFVALRLFSLLGPKNTLDIITTYLRYKKLILVRKLLSMPRYLLIIFSYIINFLKSSQLPKIEVMSTIVLRGEELEETISNVLTGQDARNFPELIKNQKPNSAKAIIREIKINNQYGIFISASFPIDERTLAIYYELRYSFDTNKSTDRFTLLAILDGMSGRLFHLSINGYKIAKGSERFAQADKNLLHALGFNISISCIDCIAWCNMKCCKECGENEKINLCIQECYNIQCPGCGS